MIFKNVSVFCRLERSPSRAALGAVMDTMLQLPFTRVCVHVCDVRVRADLRAGAHAGLGGWVRMCFWLMFVMLIEVFRESDLLQGVGEE